jgi:hypothetical protein
MKKTKSDRVLFKLELEMRRAETAGDAVLVAHYYQLIQDFNDAMSEIEGAQLRVNDPHRST